MISDNHAMDEQLVDTLTAGEYKAEVFSCRLPGEFRIVYQGPDNVTLEEGMLAGISSYKQRESEIVERLRQLSEGDPPRTVPDLGDAGEY